MLNRILGFMIIGLVCICNHIHAGQFPLGFREVLVAKDLNPVSMTMDDQGRVWLAEKHGEILILDKEGNMLPDPFISLEVDDFNERGLLGIALHPDMGRFPYVYVYYTVPNANHNRLSRFKANGDLAVPGSEEILLELDSFSASVHNGGGLIFDKNGMLFIATGDVAESTYGQNLESLHAKILRLNPDGSIPQDNPFYQQLNGKYKSIWAYGLRNPFSLAYDPVKDRLLATDVGLGDYEEINHILAGKNYGWPILEGPAQGQDLPTDYQDPLYAYDHEQGCAIVGAAFYLPRQLQFPDRYKGKFFFADYCDNYIKVLDPETGLVEETFATEVERPLAFQIDEESGSMYYLARAGIGGGSEEDNTRTRNGTLWKISYQGNGKPFISVQPSSVLSPREEDVSFSIRAGGLEPLRYQWQKNGIDMPDEQLPNLIYPQVSLADDGTTFRCIVSNQEGADTSLSVTLSVTPNQRPQPQIQLPISGNTFRAGEVIHFQGSATDPEEGTLGPASLNWRVDWHHNDHTHPALEVIGTAEGMWEVPVINETSPNVSYRIYLTATDAGNLSQTVYHELFPEFSTIRLRGNAPVSINIDGALRKIPHSFQSMIGLQRTLQAPPIQIVGDRLYYFVEWEDGSQSEQKILYTPDQEIVIGVRYGSIPLGTGIGLLGQYFFDPEFDFSGQILLQRIDSTIHVDWAQSSPDPDLIPTDSFTVRWTGEIQTLLADSYSFYVRSDDGARLWINDQLVIDQWIPQATKEHSGSIDLEAAKRYSIRLEYMERAGGANVALSWSNSLMIKQIIPKRQLYPPTGAIVEGKLWVDRNKNMAFDEADVPLENISVLLFRADDQKLLQTTQSNETGDYEMQVKLPDAYFLQFLVSDPDLKLIPIHYLSLTNQSPVFNLEVRDTLRLEIPFFYGQMIIPAHDQLGVYPNPTTGELTLQSNRQEERLKRVSWYNITGELLKADELPIQPLQLYTLDIRELSAGIYFMRIETEAFSSYKKIIKNE